MKVWRIVFWVLFVPFAVVAWLLSPSIVEALGWWLLIPFLVLCFLQAQLIKHRQAEGPALTQTPATREQKRTRPDESG